MSVNKYCMSQAVVEEKEKHGFKESRSVLKINRDTVELKLSGLRKHCSNIWARNA